MVSHPTLDPVHAAVSQPRRRQLLKELPRFKSFHTETTLVTHGHNGILLLLQVRDSALFDVEAEGLRAG